MRLSKLKLSGFKSFVDPTSINLPSSLVGIVGPNGCGKSNTIDAVRWVMGESSAKTLRGESMDDVIFTGSSSRKPVSQASVELVFDNADGTLGGEYANYAEIAIRREVSRDGQSKYLLNNTRCRRRDIRDIFLGTGLGPRSYAIIEQGMISRLIEAKPEDMRVYLEEAAGISKYKERRRETENRIRHTRDNLDRLDDLREEVDKQLAHLKRQANTAERYKILKEEERTLRGQVLALRWQDYSMRLGGMDSQINDQEVELESIVADLRKAEAMIEQERQHQVEATENFNQQQARFYQIGAEVARIEQQISHVRESRAQQSRDLEQVEKSLAEAQQHQEQDDRRIAEIDETLRSDEPAYDKLQQSQKYSAELLTEAEQHLQEWQQRWDNWSARHAESTQVAQVELSRKDQLERGVAQLDARLDRLVDEQASLDLDQVNASIEQWIAEEVSALAEEQRLQKSVEDAAVSLNSLRESRARSQQELDDLRGQIQQNLGRLASLEALQQAALGRNNTEQDAWLTEHALQDAPRLASQLKVRKGWEKAIETALGNYLEAVCTEQLDQLSEKLLSTEDLAGGTQLALVDARSGIDDDYEGATGNTGLPPLWRQVDSAPAITDFLAGIYCAANLKEAMSYRSRLAEGESIITPDGVWLGRSWLRFGEADVEGSVLQREQEITELRQLLDAEEKQAGEQAGALEELDGRIRERESQRETLQQTFNQCLRDVSEVKSRLHSGRQQLEQLHSRQSRLGEEITEVQQLKLQDEEQVKLSQTRRAEALEQIDSLTAEGETLRSEQNELRSAHEQARQRAEQDREAGQEIAIRVESLRTAREATQANLQRVKAQAEQLTERRNTLTAALALAAEERDPVEAMEASLSEQLESQLQAENTLSAARGQLEQVESRLREHEQARVRHDNRSQTAREQLQNSRMESQEVRVRIKTLEEQFIEADYDRDALLKEMPEEANVEEWTAQLETLERKISRLGPINLAAIDEYDQQLERKEYLDAQHADVIDALATLEKAIAKIDRETRQRFKDTFDRVNEKVQEFFPRLFGGGKAQLEMTGDDLLSTGVSILAQPPGKNVANIHLLSGGEKALTAVAMVFAFFELNPSPFCMLDEVDAPLDDANVGRFCELVREMSERVQFIFITHNKVTMELANQLMGVTMNEPGVSRLVAVDVKEAAELAGA